MRPETNDLEKSSAVSRLLERGRDAHGVGDGAVAVIFPLVAIELEIDLRDRFLDAGQPDRLQVECRPALGLGNREILPGGARRFGEPIDLGRQLPR
jgi:hypothetical protein